MRLQAIELIRIRLPFVAPFRTPHGEASRRDALLVHLLTASGEGWGECAAPTSAGYTREHVEGAHAVIRDALVPLLFERRDIEAEDFAGAVAAVEGRRMAKAALEMALLDAGLRSRGESLAHHLGGVRDRVPCGVALGIATSVEALVDEAQRRVAEGYLRVKLKIQPGWDVEPVAAVRGALPDTMLTVDANCAYSLADAPRLARLDAYGLAMIEQPLAAAAIDDHAALARRVRTPVCLDESIDSADAARVALARGACTIVNIKSSRVGGFAEAQRVHDVCAERGAPAWCGGMFDTGIGRAANLALAALPGFTLPADISPAGRHFEVELTSPPARMRDGCIAVPASPGLGVEVDRAIVNSMTVRTELIRP